MSEERGSAAFFSILLDLVCVDRECIAPECTVSDECSAPTPVCDNGVCVVAPDAAPRVLYVAFMSDRDGNNEIYRMNPDGSGQTNLTSNAASDQEPVWDPTGQWIAFTSNRDGSLELFVMAYDGSNPVNVSQGTAAGAAWSPDGSTLTFTSNRSGTQELYSVRRDGSMLVGLTNLGSVAGAAWSPDGSRLLFTASGRVYVMNADGSGPTPISAGTDTWPQWRPDGDMISYCHRNSFTDFDVYVANPDGSGIANITNSPGALEYEAVWSSDGLWLAGTGGTDTNPEVFVVAVAGPGPVDVTSSAAADRQPCWLPGDESLLFTSNRDGNGEIYRVARAGGASSNLTNSAGDDSRCAIRPQ